MNINYEQIRIEVRQQVARLLPEDRKRLLTDLLQDEQPTAKQVPARDFSREHQWLRENAQQYRGQMLALSGCELLASGMDPVSVLATAKATGKKFLLHRVPAEGEVWGGGLW